MHSAKALSPAFRGRYFWDATLVLAYLGQLADVRHDDGDRDGALADEPLLFVAEEQAMLDCPVLGAEHDQIVFPGGDLVIDCAVSRIVTEAQDVRPNVGRAEYARDAFELRFGVGRWKTRPRDPNGQGVTRIRHVRGGLGPLLGQ